MKIREFIIAPKTVQDTTSCGTTYSGQKDTAAQDLVPQDLVPEIQDGHIESHPDHSAITEGVSQILRRVKGKGIRQDSDAHQDRGKVVSWRNLLLVL
jgi:hypothetical protein